ncbi:MAG: MIP/aquaporin family protein [bacterium]
MRQLLAQMLSEAIGTLALVFVGLSSISLFLGTHLAMLEALPGVIRLGLVLLGFGSVIWTVITSPCGRISGAHINPAVSLAFALRGDLPWPSLPGYVLAQLCGAWLGALLAQVLWGATLASLNTGLTLPSASYPLWASIAVEAVGTLLLMWLILWSIARPQRQRWIALSVGSFIWLYGWATAPVSGASFNPARSIGPAIASGDYHSLWLYILFPIAGAAIAAVWCRLAPASCGCGMREGCR